MAELSGRELADAIAGAPFTPARRPVPALSSDWQPWLGKAEELVGHSFVVGGRCHVRSASGPAFTVDLRSGATSVAEAEPPVHSQLRELIRGLVAPVAVGAAGHLLVHASAVAFDGAVTAMAAPSGSGKSSIRRALAERGGRQVSDDALLVAISSKGVPTAEAVSVLDPRLDDLEPPAPDGALPLRAIVGLSPSPGSAAAAVRLTGSAALEVILANAYSPVSPDGAIPERAARTAIDLVATIPVIELSFGHTGRVETGTLDALEAAVAAAG